MNARTQAPAVAPRSVEVIVVAFHSGDSLVSCLAALPAAGKNLELAITVVDNGSSENLESEIRKSGVSAEVLRSPVNLGYGGGNNLALRRALKRRQRPSAVLVVNPDVELRPGALSELFAILEETCCAAVSPRIQDASGTHGESPLRSLWGKPLRPFDRQGRRLRSVDRLPGSCMLMRTDVLAQVGLFDERYFLYWEEIDLCCRMRLANHTLLIAEDVAAVHDGAGDGSLKRHRIYYMWRNQIYFSFKNYGPFLGLFFVARRLLIADVREVCGFLKRGKTELIFAGLAGLWAGIRGESGAGVSSFAAPQRTPHGT